MILASFCNNPLFSVANNFLKLGWNIRCALWAICLRLSFLFKFQQKTVQQVQDSLFPFPLKSCSTSMTCIRRICQEATFSCSRGVSHVVNSLNLLFDYNCKSLMLFFKKKNKQKTSLVSQNNCSSPWSPPQGCMGYTVAAAKNRSKNSPHPLSVYACCATKSIEEQGAFLTVFPTLG